MNNKEEIKDYNFYSAKDYRKRIEHIVNNIKSRIGKTQPQNDSGFKESKKNENFDKKKLDLAQSLNFINRNEEKEDINYQSQVVDNTIFNFFEVKEMRDSDNSESKGLIQSSLELVMETDRENEPATSNEWTQSERKRDKGGSSSKFIFFRVKNLDLKKKIFFLAKIFRY